MSDLYREATDDDLLRLGRVRSIRVVRVEPVGTLTVRIRNGEYMPDTNLFWSDDLVPEGKYALFPLEADDDA